MKSRNTTFTNATSSSTAFRCMQCCSTSAARVARGVRPSGLGDAPDRRGNCPAARAMAGVMALAMMGFAPAHAGVIGSVTLASDYIFRGVSQTNGDPAVQAGVEYAADSGVYAGAWGSNVSWLSDYGATGLAVSNSLELDVCAGYRGKLGERVSYDVGALYYGYPGDYPAGFNRPDTGEVYAGLTVAATDALSLGAKYSHAVTDLFGYVDSDGSGYLDVNATYALGGGWTLVAHGGEQWIEGNEAYEYADWKLGVSKAFDNGFSLGLAYTDTDADEALYTNGYGHDIAGSAVALSVSKGF
ncbi:uncharacterized protein (TIGR02001 family) [Lysobacter ruishenii]|uniref:Uncharacterized protein (TIGR02001 family) n=2 Tax=Aerolutibacter ruishenii TaxID=686800 RepID=A0A562M1M5_9GAMM|nr:uncharacterized protein (TIGR02001 family) [Lysobacter ruishenii]